MFYLTLPLALTFSKFLMCIEVSKCWSLTTA